MPFFNSSWKGFSISQIVGIVLYCKHYVIIFQFQASWGDMSINKGGQSTTMDFCDYYSGRERLAAFLLEEIVLEENRCLRISLKCLNICFVSAMYSYLHCKYSLA